MEATILFKDGTTLTAEKNGSCLILDEKPTFPEDITGVTVTTEEETEVFRLPKVQECASIDGKYWFTFIEQSGDELALAALSAENEMLANAIVELAEIIGGE